MIEGRDGSSWRRARQQAWPLVDVLTTDARVGVHPPVGGCITSTNRDSGATDSVGDARFAVGGDSVCDPSDAG